MRLRIRAKQIVSVTGIVLAAVLLLSALFLTRVSSVVFHETVAHGRLLSNAIFHRAREVVTAGGDDPYAGLRNDPGLRSILAATFYGESLTGAHVLDRDGLVVASGDPMLVGRRLPLGEDVAALEAGSALEQLRVIYFQDARTLEVVQTIFRDDEVFGSIRVGVSTLLMRAALVDVLRPTLGIAALAIAFSVVVAGFLAQLLLRPIHVLQGGLTSLGKGEFGVTLDLPPGDEFGELGSFFNTVSQQLSADRTALAGQSASVQTAVEHLEDAVALFAPSGELRFSNPAMGAVLPSSAIGRPLRDVLQPGHPYRVLVEDTLAARASRGPVQVTVPSAVGTAVGTAAGIAAGTAAGIDVELQADLTTHVIEGVDHELVGVLLVARDAGYSSRVHSVLAYSRKLVALGRLTAGIAHEVKNPLNAMMIHLELLRTKIHRLAQAAVPESAAAGVAGRAIAASRGDPGPLPAPFDGALSHVAIIEGEIRRLDEVVQGFLRFARPEDLRLQAVRLDSLLAEIAPFIHAEAQRRGVKVTLECPPSVPAVNGDAAMLRQVFTNLTLNACQAMPTGGTLRVSCAAKPGQRVQIRVEDSGAGIAPEHLNKVFELYFTTKDHGTGIGLSMVYRIVQLHDGEIDVQSTPGHGTTFTVSLPIAK